MLFTYTEQTAREEVTNHWSQLGRIRFEHLNADHQEALSAFNGWERQSVIRNVIWRFEDLNEEGQDTVDFAVEALFDDLEEEVA